MARPGGIAKIVVGVDGSEHAKYALQWAARMAKGTDSEVVAVYAIIPPVYFDTGYAAMPVQYDEDWRAEMKRQLEGEWTKPLADAGVKFRTTMQDGRAAGVIAAVADAEDADVLIVGRRGRGGVAELVLGSVSHELVLQSKRPILVISTAPR